MRRSSKRKWSASSMNLGSGKRKSGSLKFSKKERSKLGRCRQRRFCSYRKKTRNTNLLLNSLRSRKALLRFNKNSKKMINWSNKNWKNLKKKRKYLRKISLKKKKSIALKCADGKGRSRQVKSNSILYRESWKRENRKTVSLNLKSRKWGGWSSITSWSL